MFGTLCAKCQQHVVTLSYETTESAIESLRQQLVTLGVDTARIKRLLHNHLAESKTASAVFLSPEAPDPDKDLDIILVASPGINTRERAAVVVDGETLRGRRRTVSSDAVQVNDRGDFVDVDAENLEAGLCLVALNRTTLAIEASISVHPFEGALDAVQQCSLLRTFFDSLHSRQVVMAFLQNQSPEHSSAPHVTGSGGVANGHMTSTAAKDEHVSLAGEERALEVEEEEGAEASTDRRKVRDEWLNTPLVPEAVAMVKLLGAQALDVRFGHGYALVGALGSISGSSTENSCDVHDTVLLELSKSKLLSDGGSAIDDLMSAASRMCGTPMPLCSLCFSSEKSRLNKEAASIQEETASFETMCQQLQAQKLPINSLVDYDSEVAEAEKAVLEAEAELAKLREESAELIESQVRLQELQMELDMAQQQHLEEKNAFQFKLLTLWEERDRSYQATQMLEEHLDMLRRTCVLNDAFYISHNCHFGTVNGFRLGFLKDLGEAGKVEFDEINAALGQVALLTAVLAEVLQCDFQQYWVRVRGSTSSIISKSDRSEGNLFGPPMFAFFRETAFDRGLVRLLRCVRELESHMKRIEPEFALNYVINDDDTIGGPFSVRFSNGEEQWTRSMKHLLFNLKQLLVATARMDDQRK